MLRDSNPYHVVVLSVFETPYRSFGSIHWRNRKDSNLRAVTDSRFPDECIYHSATVP